MLLLLGHAVAQDYPLGPSTQTYKGRKFQLVIPQPRMNHKYSLMFIVNGNTSSFSSLLDDGFVLCASGPKGGGTYWASSEAKSR